MPFPQLDHGDGGIPINFSIFAFVQVTELKLGLTAACGRNFFGVNFKSQQRNTPSLAHLASTRGKRVLFMGYIVNIFNTVLGSVSDIFSAVVLSS
ncbi:hypothetical protein [Corynebacterium glutamicum]|uniref:hypothetical protein n=1 Tax=Corynebacterium glutamicum TaxID=1718 RepID=UPI00117D8ED0|nr:hypothetical protein [Corynebacterium glutamicum]QDQ19575.1 hypothetical protein FOL53_01435 [Corynebacterium glutamicum]QDQ23140.1 hypothetical protein FOY32_06065 [Corynebacterium glutamicum]